MSHVNSKILVNMTRQFTISFHNFRCNHIQTCQCFCHVLSFFVFLLFFIIVAAIIFKNVNVLSLSDMFCMFYIFSKFSLQSYPKMSMFLSCFAFFCFLLYVFIIVAAIIFKNVDFQRDRGPRADQAVMSFFYFMAS